jgi:hypothetical protein
MTEHTDNDISAGHRDKSTRPGIGGWLLDELRVIGTILMGKYDCPFIII